MKKNQWSACETTQLFQNCLQGRRCRERKNLSTKSRYGISLNKVNTTKTSFNPLSANLTKWSNTLKQFVCNLPTNCLSVFDHFVILALKGLRNK